MASNAVALKKKAAEFEQKKQFDKALALYRQVLDEDDGEEDVSLFNRVGDMYLKAGLVGDAMELFERAVDRYDDAGLYNNAIALCNKILRQSPGRITVYYKLGKVSAKKGFKNDAKVNFLEYATRKQKDGDLNEAFRSLKEFADLCPDQDDIRLMLADQLSKEGRGPEAMEQLQILFDRYTAEGNAASANATAERMRAIDPSAEPVTSSGPAKHRKSSDLVFLDLDEAATGPRKATPLGVPPIAPPPKPAAAPPPPPPAPPPAEMPDPLELADLTPVVDAGLPLLSVTPAPMPVVPEPLDLADHEAGPVLAEYGESMGVPVARLTGGQPVITDGPTDGPTDGLDDLLMPVDADTAFPAVPDVVSDGPFDLPFITEETGGATVSAEDTASGRPTMQQPMFDEPSPAEASALLDAAFGGLDSLDHPPAPEETAAPPVVPMFEPTVAEEPAPVEVQRLSLADAAAAFMADVDAADAAAADAAEVADAAPKRRTSVSLARNVLTLRGRVDREPENWDLLRTYAEALLDDGERDAGLAALESAMIGYEKADDLISARSVAEEIVRLEPTSIRHQQKRVEYCFRGGDRAGLVDAYVDLADALFKDGQTDKAKSVYQRVLELAPGEMRAETALLAFGDSAPEAPAAPAPAAEAPHRYTGTLQTPLAAPTQPAPAKPAASDDFIDLGDLLRDDEPLKDTRMVVEEKEPTGDEDADFQDMLQKFKQGVAENVEEEDYDSHYDLGVAFKEMGLLDEAIGEFQKALRGQQHRVRTHEALGQCFIEKGMWPVAATILLKVAMEPGLDDAQLIGVNYLLGQAQEALGKRADALAAYQRVYAVDIRFQDVAQRVAALSVGST
jgi:tetratricopeptide (TPR) repeat protein